MVTFNDYSAYPGVLLYDFIDHDDALVMIAATSSLRFGAAATEINLVRVQQVYVRQQLSHSVSLAHSGQAADRERLKTTYTIAASLSRVAAIGALGVGGIGFA